MAVYEYVCRECHTSFELRRAMADADRSVICPSGHADVRRKLSVFASVGATAGAATASAGASGPAAGCCGGGCGCRH
jgi:putative FmdB family regulatory protein